MDDNEIIKNFASAEILYDMWEKSYEEDVIIKKNFEKSLEEIIKSLQKVIKKDDFEKFYDEI